ncbi:MAG: UDP-N-acetylmuramate:L-alanyl-gamma-D-glutamyl-meso-diaminopimelate ligase [Bdellovibrionales bacterium]|nr:UDP-N-acetylmuramate:L-alanyl-gamma-D-glutamyl-meso-diaminopimelate ligase [Bdellovibrionales bacterium]
MIDLKPGAHIHLIGICGTAMASLAALLKERGYKITGSDRNVYPPMSTFLEEQGIEIKPDYKAEHLNPAPDFVVVGNVISKHYEEAEALLKSNIPYASLPETLRDFVIENRHSLVVCGTHGKTTTTSMASWVADQAGLDPGFLIGGIAKNFSTSFRNPKGGWFVIEGDEYDTAFFAKVPKFLFYNPRSVILTSVEFDHADIYPNLEAVLKAFTNLMEIIPQDGLLVYNAEDSNIAKILNSCRSKKISYGFSHGDWQVSEITYLREGLEFNIMYQGSVENRIFVPMFGRYNITNALAVYAMAKTHGWDVDLKKAFAQFAGVKRRQELIGEPNHIQVIEDFAHHPTAVLETLKSFKNREGQGRLIAVFEPRSNTSRRNVFQKQYTEALAVADSSYICEPFAGTSPLPEEERMDVNQLVEDIRAQGKQALCFSQVEEAIDRIQAEARPGDTVVIMSNGGFQGIYGKILKALNP